MALNGSFYGSTDNQFIKPRIDWFAVQDVAGNYSDVTATLYYSRTNQGYETYGTWRGSLTIDGQTTEASQVLRITYNSNTEAISCTVRVCHDDYGEKTLTISAEGSMKGTSLTGTRISGEITLDAIARASGIGATPANVGAASMIAVNRKNGAFTHTIAWQFGALMGYIGADWGTTDQPVKLTDTGISFVLPEDFYSQIPDSATGSCTLICTTYSGDAQIGQSQRCSFTVTADKESCCPQVVGTVQDSNPRTLALTGDPVVLVRGISTALCTVTAAARNGASLTEMFVNDVRLEGRCELPEIETDTFRFRAWDSRGYGGSDSITARLIPYIKPTGSLSVQRTDPTSGNAVLTLKGAYFAGSFGAAENILSVSCRINGGPEVSLTPQLSDGEYVVAAQLTGLEYTQTHTVTVCVSDRLSAVERSATVQKGIPVFDWDDNDFAFHVPVNFDSVGNLALFCYPVGSVYISVNPTSPASLFGGSWERLKDRFLLAAGDSYDAGTTGGTATVTLTEGQLPAHSHGYLDYWTTQAGASYGRSAVAVNGDGTGLEGAGANDRSRTASTGGGQPHENMPPYFAVYMWKRVA